MPHPTDNPPPEREETPPAPEAKAEEKDAPVVSGAPAGTPFPIVALGASAGGLAALEEFFTHMPAGSGMAFVVIMHLMRDRESKLSQLLQEQTGMTVVEIEDDLPVVPNQVYVIPPNHELGLLNGRCQLLPLRDKERALTIDSFLRHLAADQGNRAICVILSGSGSDGSLGLKAVSENGGLVIAQEPETAEYAGMPARAIETGLVDRSLAPAAMPDALRTYVARTDFTTKEPTIDGSVQDGLNKIYLLLRSETGNDFSQYRAKTLYRRITKRMAVHKIDHISHYVDYLRQNSAEVRSLYQEILIAVTQFFREPAAFEAFKEKALPLLFEDRPADQPLRLWVPGCSTGEEAYTLAMLIHEYQENNDLAGVKVYIFATDVNNTMVEKARLGEYPRAIAADVPVAYLERYFTRRDHTYHVESEIREMVIFAAQNLLQDPPFSRLDCISCRNVLIYLKRETQQKALALFQYALKPDGMLFLGSSESLGDFSDSFIILDRKHRLFRRNFSAAASPPDVDFFKTLALPEDRSEGKSLQPLTLKEQDRLLESSLLEHYEPVGILLDADNSILYTYGQVDRYLKLAAGEARLHIMKMIRPGLDSPLAAAIRRVRSRIEVVRQQNVWVKTNGDEFYVNFTVKPAGNAPERGLILVIIEQVRPVSQGAAYLKTGPDEDDDAAGLKKELAQARQHLQDMKEHLQSATEEHRSYAEELQSANEELQSTNEELSTSQEELQSVNEELVTANVEIQKKNEALRRSNDDLHNLLSATEIATIFLDLDLKIKRFTPATREIVNLIDSDIGRPLEHTVSNLKNKSPVAEARQVLSTLNSLDKEVQTEEGDWYNMRISPYRTANQAIDGVVLTFAPITTQKMVEEELRRARDYARTIIDATHEGILLLDDSLQVVSANKPFYRQFQLLPEETEGQFIYEVGGRQWNIPDLRRLLEEVIPQDRMVDQFEIEHDFPHLGRRRMRLNARRMVPPENEAIRILLAIEDITGQSS